MRASTLIATAIVLVMVGASLGVAIGNARAAEGSRDSFGYYYTDSKAPAPSVAFNWINISATGTNSGVYGYNDWGGPFPIGFNFSFYGNRYTAFNISSNGFITLGGYSYDWSNDQIPYSSSPNNFIAGYWDYLTPDSGEILYQTVGSAPNRQLVVQYTNVDGIYAYYDMTFEIILNETSGDIWLQYLTLNGNTGSSATIGIENSGGTVGVQYGYNSAVLQDNLAIRISQGPIYLGPQQASIGMPSETLSYRVTLTNRQDFSDSFAISATSVLGWTVAVYDSLYNPLTDTDGDLLPDSGTLASYESKSLIVNVTIPASPASSPEVTTLNASSHANPLVYRTCTLTSSVLPAWFEPPHDDYGYDNDGDGLYNYLVVSTMVTVFTAGWYEVYGELRTSTDGFITSDYNYTYLAVGTHQVDLYFYGWLIRNTGVNGPYHVHLYLYDDSWNLRDTDTHTTDSYLYTEFMYPPGEFDPPHSDAGIDTDGDGLYDYLAIDVSLNINYAGNFEIYGYLDDSTYTSIDYVYNLTYLDAGAQTVRLLYDAWTISKYAVSGVFHVDLYLYAQVDGVWNYIEYNYYTTASYSLSSFERPSAMFDPPHDEHVNDTDGDGLYNYLAIDVQVNVTDDGDYVVTGILYNWWGDIIDIVSNSTHLAPGLHTVELDFPGWPIRYNDDNDDFDIELFLMKAGVQQDHDWYETAVYYYWDDFETAPGWFEPPYDDYGVDTNSDTLYDYLVVEIPVNVTLNGTYTIEAGIGPWWGTFETLTNTTYLTVGLHTITFYFTGWIIYDNGYDGPYTVEMYLYDSGDREMDYDSYDTAAYDYTQFAPQPAYLGWPHSFYAQDSDDDSIYENFVVNVSVQVTTPGLFYIEVTMYDGSWWIAAVAGVWATLDAGAQVVQVPIPGWALYSHGYDGPYWVYIYLYDENKYYLDSDSLYTSTSYYHDDFDSTMPRIVSPWTASAPIVDGEFGTTEWADAIAVDLMTAYPANGVEGTLLVKNNDTMLFICVDAFGDTTSGSYDYSSVSFDTNNDGALTDGAEDEFVLRSQPGNSQTHYVYDSGILGWSVDCSPFDDLLLDHDGLAGAFGFGNSTGHLTDHRIYEYAIPLALLGATPGDVLGFLLGSYYEPGVYDWSEGLSSYWPADFIDVTEPGEYGDLEISARIAVPPPATTATVTGTAGSADWYVSSVSVTLAATGGSGGVDYTEYRLDGGAWTTYTAAIAITGEGTHTLEYRSADNAAQLEATKTLSVKIDTVAPTTSSGVSGANLWLNATDDTSGLGSTMYRVDNGTWMACTGMLTITGVGTHLVEFYTLDAAGNQEATKSVTVVVEESDGGDGGTPSAVSDAMLWIALIAAAVIAAIIVLFFLMKRRKKQEPAYMPPAPVEAMPPAPPAPPS